MPQDALEQALVDLNVVYIPKTLNPGPAFAFPVFDALEELRQLQIRVTNPEEWGGIRYLAAVNPSEFVGPVWFGLDDRTIAAAMQHKAVVLVEGPFDLLAVRVCCPDIPSLTTLTKKLTPDHLTTLSLLGVTTIYPMFDHEKSEVGGLAAQILAAKASGFHVIPLVCPAKDPAEALKYPVKTLDLQTLLGRITKPITVDTASNPLD